MNKSNSGSSSTNIVGVHYRVGKKLGEGSFGVLYEGFIKKKKTNKRYIMHYIYTLFFIIIILFLSFVYLIYKLIQY
jgi:hypothetical protein